MPDRFSRLIPNDNVYLVETAADLPEVLSQWTLYNLQFDPGSGTGLYFSPDGTSLVRLAAGAGTGFTGFGVWRSRTETTSPPASGQIRFNNSDPELATELFIAEINDAGTDVSVFLALLTAGSFLYIQEQALASNSILVEVSTNVDSGTFRTIGIANVEQQGAPITQNTRVIVVGTPAGGGGGGGVTTFEGRAGAVVAIQADYAGLYVDSFIGRVGPVVAVEADYSGFYLVKGPFSTQTVQSNVIFTDKVTFTDVTGVQFDPSVELDLRNPADNTTWFMQYTAQGPNMGLAGSDFNSVFMDFGSSFTHFRFGDPLLLTERAAAVGSVTARGQIWVRDDTPNILMFTDDAGNDFTVDVTAA